MRWLPAPRFLVRTLAALLVALLAIDLAPASAATDAATQSEILARARAYKQLQVQLMKEKFRRELAENRERGREWRKEHGKREGGKRRESDERAVRGEKELRGERAKPAVLEAGEEIAARPRTRSQDELSSAPGGELFAPPINVIANDPSQDFPSTSITQSEQMIASFGTNVVTAWNDGGGSSGQGYAYSANGGVSFTDGGDFPAVPSGAAWSSDPVVVVNEKTGAFYFCALADGPGSVSALAVVKGTFSGGVLNWGTPVVIRSVDGTTKALDKPWMAADSLTGNLYVTYTLFTASDDSIEVQRSTDDNTTWQGPVIVSSAAAAGAVQGSRVAVGPSGELYAIWNEIGPVDADFMRIRKSTNNGVSFATEQTAATFFANFGTGAPGFNRERGLEFPAIAVDRTTGPNRGRVYVTYNESLNYYDDAIATGTNRAETENNNFFNRANSFTMGQTLTGTVNSTGANGPNDYFSWSATQGQSYIFYCNSIGAIFYTMRVFCGQDTTTRLALAGDLSGTPGNAAVLVWTAPSTGTYYFRMSWVSGGATSSTYSVQTGIANHGAEVGRDQRDAIVTTSDNGTTWNAPVRVNDDLARFDNWLPEVAVGGDGCPYVTWYDWRDTPAANCGGRSHIYAARSTTGGTSWQTNMLVTTAQNNWTASLSNLAPNQGDYMHLFADGAAVRPAWADTRNGNPDVFTAAIPTGFALTSCTNDTSVTNGPGVTVSATFTANNLHPLYANDYTFSLTSVRSWPLPSPGATSALALGGFGGQLLVSVPDTATSGTNPITLRVTNLKGTQVASCVMNVQVTAPQVGVEDGTLAFGLLQNVPNPANRSTRIGFSLPRAGEISLAIYGLRGERVRTLAHGPFDAGTHSLAWDGRDDHGRPVAAGAYFYRLEGLGQSATRRMVWMP